MVINSLFSIKLHARIYGGKYFQPICVDIIRLSISLKILIAPSIKGICIPCDGIKDKLILVPGRIIRAIWTCGHHILAQKFTEVGSQSILVICTMKVQFQFFICVLVIFCFRKIAGLLHLSEHDITSFGTTFRITNGIIKRRILTKTDEHGRLCDCQVLGLFVEIRICSRFNSNRIVKKIKIIKV